MNYLLLIYGKSDNQDEFVNTIAQDISVVSDIGEVKYYSGPDSIILTFQCTESMESLEVFLKMLYSEVNMVYILLPYDKDKLSVQMDKEISDHLFNIEQNKEKTEKLSEVESMVKKLMEQTEDEDFLSAIEEEEFEMNNYKDQFLKRKEISEPSLDQLLDKINASGISSLSEKELSLLEKYSKK